jgi:hypothetical protein
MERQGFIWNSRRGMVEPSSISGLVEPRFVRAKGFAKALYLEALHLEALHLEALHLEELWESCA